MSSFKYEALAALGFFLVIYSALLLSPSAPQPGVEAVVRFGIGRDLLIGLPRGRHALIGSVAWAPGPTILALPLLPILQTHASSAVGALAMTLFGIVAIGRWRAMGIPMWLRWPLVAALAFNPVIVDLVRIGSSHPLIVLQAAVAFGFLGRWFRSQDVRSLAYIGIMSALMVVTRAETIVVAAGLMLVVAVSLIGRQGRGRFYRRATLVVLVTPLVYAIAVWTSANWLILRDTGYYLRGVGEALAELTGRGSGRFPNHAVIGMAEDYLQQWPLIVVPGLAMLVASAWSTRDRIAQGAVGVGLAAVCAGTFALGWVAHRDDLLRIDPVPSMETIRSIEAYTAEAFPWDHILVDGYLGYCFAPHDPFGKGQYLHEMGLSIDAVRQRGYDRPLRLLIPPPQGVAFWEDAHLTNPRLTHGDVPGFLIAGILPGDPPTPLSADISAPGRWILYDVVER